MRVVVPAVGGGFGLKVHLYVEEAILPFLSRLSGAPVKWCEDRYEHLAASGHSKEVVCMLELGARRAGHVPRAARAARRRRRRPPGSPVDEPDRPALRRVDAPGHLLDRGPSLRGRRGGDEQVPEHGVPGRGLDVGTHGPRGADRRRSTDARHRPAGAAAPELPAGRPAGRLRDRLPLRRRQLRGVDPPRARARRLRRAPGATAPAPRARAGTSASGSARSSSRAGGRRRSRPTWGFPAPVTSIRSA